VRDCEQSRARFCPTQPMQNTRGSLTLYFASAEAKIDLRRSSERPPAPSPLPARTHLDNRIRSLARLPPRRSLLCRRQPDSRHQPRETRMPDADVRTLRSSGALTNEARPSTMRRATPRSPASDAHRRPRRQHGYSRMRRGDAAVVLVGATSVTRQARGNKVNRLDSKSLTFSSPLHLAGTVNEPDQRVSVE
jgi:hypothetical protein